MAEPISKATMLDYLETNDQEILNKFSNIIESFYHKTELAFPESNFKTPEQFGIKSDGTDEGVKLQALFDLGGTILLSKDYTTSVKLVAKGTTLITGLGSLNQAVGSNPTALLETTEKSKVEYITIRGTYNLTKEDVDQRTAVNVIGFQNRQEAIDLVGIGTTSGILNKGLRCSIKNVTFINTSKWCIEFQENSNTAALQPLYTNVTGCLGYLNYGVFNFPEKSEYQSILGNVFKYNLIGVYNIGGNNSLVGNKIDHNRVNMILREGHNDTHGEVTGGSMNHGKLANIIVEKIANGHIFSGVSMFDGGELGIDIKESKGINITGSTLSRMTITNDGSYDDVEEPGVNKIQNCIFDLIGSTYLINELSTNSQSNLITKDNEMLGGDDTTGWKTHLLNNQKYDKDLVVTETINTKFLYKQKDVKQYHVGGTSISGALAIKMPFGFSNQNIKLEISIYDLLGENTNLSIVGYLPSSGNWVNVSANYKQGDNSFNISFGRDETDDKAILYIGNLNSIWRYQHVSISNFEANGGSLKSPQFYKHGWKFSIEDTALQNVSAEVLNIFIGDLNAIDYDFNGFVSNSGSTNLPEAVDGTIDAKFKPTNNGFGTQTYLTVTGNYYVRGKNSGTFSSWSLLN